MRNGRISNDELDSEIWAEERGIASDLRQIDAAEYELDNMRRNLERRRQRLARLKRRRSRL